MKKKTVFKRDYRALINTLVEARKAAELTQGELARRVQRDQPIISKIETLERRLDIVEFKAICKVLRLDPAKLLEIIKG